MNRGVADYIQQIHDAPTQGVFYATGGGMQVGDTQAQTQQYFDARQHDHCQLNCQ